VVNIQQSAQTFALVVSCIHRALALFVIQACILSITPCIPWFADFYNTRVVGVAVHKHGIFCLYRIPKAWSEGVAWVQHS
jgi:hypothetical protein